MNISQLIQDLGNFSFDVNSWGSCQYSSALAMFNAYFKLREKYDRHPGPFIYSNDRIDLNNPTPKRKSILKYLEVEHSLLFFGEEYN